MRYETNREKSGMLLEILSKIEKIKQTVYENIPTEYKDFSFARGSVSFDPVK